MKFVALKMMALTFALLVSSGCVHAAGSSSEEQLSGLGAAVTKVSAAVNTTVKYKSPPADLKDGKLLAFATAHNPRLLKKFADYTLKARQEGKASSVLICDKNGEVALIEDAGCTAKLDLYIWKNSPNSPCDYVLDLAKVCAQ
ncbi:MAG: hypothetical protein JKY92_07765 [Magnetovibrio sp.]|nr:hypothetical protein [Magnetovibrio sp.]